MSIEKPTTNNENEKFEWGLEDNEKIVEIVPELDDILASKDVARAEKILNDPKLLHSLVIKRGSKDVNLNRFNDVAALVIQDECGPNERIETVPGERLLKALHERGLPEQVLGELLAAAYHQRDRERFLHIYSIIKENAENLQNKELLAVADHDMATWAQMVENDQNKAIELNNRVKAADLGIISHKAEFGLGVQKVFKPSKMARHMEEVAKNMEKIEHHYDAHRAKIEEIKARMEMIRTSGLKGNELKDQKDICIELLKQVGKFAEKHDYHNLQILYFQTGRDLAQILGNNRQAKYFGRNLAKAQESSHYVMGDKGLTKK